MRWVSGLTKLSFEPFIYATSAILGHYPSFKLVPGPHLDSTGKGHRVAAPLTLAILSQLEYYILAQFSLSRRLTQTSTTLAILRPQS